MADSTPWGSGSGIDADFYNDELIWFPGIQFRGPAEFLLILPSSQSVSEFAMLFRVFAEIAPVFFR